ARPPRAAPRPERARSVASRRNRRVLARTVARPAAGVRSGDAPGLAALAIDARRRKPRLAHLRRRLRRGPLRAIRSQPAMSWMAPFDVRSHLTWMRVGIASVWLLFGLFFKALDGVPRHRQIVARVVGADRAGLVLWFVALGEIALGLWMLVGRFLPVC